MRFVDFLKATVMLSAAAATALAAVTVLAASNRSQSLVALLAVAWWVLAALIGTRVGRRADASPPIARLLAGARTTDAMPEQRPGAVLLNRLWPLLLCSVVAGALAFLAPQVSGIGAGFAIIWSLAWRHQDSAVSAIEERDGAAFYVMRTSPFRPMVLQRTPGMKVTRPQRSDGVPT